MSSPKRGSSLSKEQTTKLKEAWNLFDANGDGKITSQEVASVMKKLGMKPDKKQIKAMIKGVDLDGNGTVEWDEFIAVMAKHFEVTKDVMMEAFKTFDLNGDGFISREELKSVMHEMGNKLSDQEVEDMMKRADSNHDGRIDFDEFSKMMSVHSQ